MVERTRSLLKDAILSNPGWALQAPMKHPGLLKLKLSRFIRFSAHKREEAWLPVQAAGSGWVKVGLTFLTHGPPAAALFFRFRDVPDCP